MASLSVLLPTLNSMPLLPAHLESMKPWLDLAEEIIVVDSFSTDGTTAFIQEKLSSYPVKIHEHPRGLYQSWNSGIARAAGRWLYISTVGDSITREQLLHHVELAESFDADAIVSAPHWIDQNDHPTSPVRWAVNDIIDGLALSQPRLLAPAASHFFALLHTYSSALLGSAASDLFKTSHFQKYPFPTDYGMSGDGAWGLRHAYDTRLVVTPRQGSTFRIHAKPYSLADYHVNELGERLHQLGKATHNAHAAQADAAGLDNAATLALTKEVTVSYAHLKTLRKQRRPWFLFPDVWAARLRSKRAVQNLKRHTAMMTAVINRSQRSAAASS